MTYSMRHLLRSGSFLTSRSTALGLASLTQLCERIRLAGRYVMAVGCEHCLSEASPSVPRAGARNERSAGDRGMKGITVGTRLWGRGDEPVDKYGLSTAPPLRV
jgi:hypothetical protein